MARVSRPATSDASQLGSCNYNVQCTCSSTYMYMYMYTEITTVCTPPGAAHFFFEMYMYVYTISMHVINMTRTCMYTVTYPLHPLLHLALDQLPLPFLQPSWLHTAKLTHPFFSVSPLPTKNMLHVHEQIRWARAS